MAIIEDQLIEVKWNNKQANYYLNKGYHKINTGETFLVNVSDLTPSSNKRVKVLCDFCGKLYQRQMNKLSTSSFHGCSSKCHSELLKTSENKILYSKKDLIEYFFKYYNEFGVYPHLKDFDRAEGYPSSTAYYRNWESYSDFLKENKIISIDNIDGWYICDEDLLRNYYEFGSKDYILDNLMIKRKWDTVKKKASRLGLKRKISRSLYTKEDLIDKLINFKKEHNVLPKISDCMTNGLPSQKVFKNKFGSWNNALREAGLSTNTNFEIDKDEIILRAVSFYQINGRSPYSYEILKSNTPLYKYWETYEKFLQSIDLPLNRKERNLKFKTDEELIHDYKNLYKSLGRIPLANDINNCEELASFTTYLKRFKTYENIWDICDIKHPLKILKKSKYGSICLDKNGNLCKSFAEMIITNLFIDNGIRFIKEYNYKKVFPEYIGKTLVLDWYLPDFKIAVEYFGLYNKSQNNDIANSYREKTKKKIEIFQKSEIPLIDLYQEDLNEIYLSRIVNKFKNHSIILKVPEKNLYKNRKTNS